MKILLVIAAFLMFWPISLVPVVQAEVCIRAVNSVNKRGRTITRLRSVNRSGSCKRGEVAALTGPTGQDGSIRVYGDGSAGPLNIIANTNWNTSPPIGNNLQFTDCIIEAGIALTVPSGTVIRCTGNVTVLGNISTGTGAWGGFMGLIGSANETVSPMFAHAPAGIAIRGAGFGQFRSSDSGGTNSLRGGRAGIGLQSELQASLLTKQHPYGGGAGGAATAGSNFTNGGSGGGAFSLYARGTISIGGNIYARGTNSSAGGGGGGGGVIVLASQSSIVFSGSGNVDVKGGNGGASNSRRGAGGGGGGGIIVYAAPAVPTVTGANSVVTAGAAGSTAIAISAWPRQAGAGGGGSGGDGGDGGAVEADGTANAPTAATNGRAITLPFDPTSILF